MKRLITLAIIVGASLCVATAQNYRHSRYYNPRTNRLDYSSRGRVANYGNSYYGLRVGPSFTTVNSDDKYLDGGSVKTGLDVGFVAGVNVGYRTPLYLETGISYIEKGGKAKANGERFSYELNYLELPMVLKYVAAVDRDFSVQPFLGGYVACGVGGKIKDFGMREAYSSFSDTPYSFGRFDAGLRLGCGMQYQMLYAELGYDLGLANISHDDFDESHNSALMLTVGLNF